jgi:GNAT superfamily N-acetyltransferase
MLYAGGRDAVRGPTSSLATISEGPNDPVPEALCACPPDQIPTGKWFAPDVVCEHPDGMQIEVVPFGNTDETAIRHAYGISRAAAAVATPDIPFATFPSFLAGVRTPFPGRSRERALGLLDRTPVGCLTLDLPEHANLDNAGADLFVHPDHRRRGVGRALHAHAVRRIRELGRKRLTGETVEGLPGGDAFAVAMGATARLKETRSRLDVSALDQDKLDAMLAEAWTHADGYRFVRWEGVPPARFLDDVAYLDSRLMEDAPMGTLEWEPEKIDAEQVRRSEQQRLDRGMGRFHGGIEHEATGRLVGWTTLSGADDTPTHLWQQITIVEPGHRGHRLGMIVKLENLRHAREHRPQLAAIDTFNAAVNKYMLAINVAIGFRPADSWMQWQQTV